MNTNMYTKHIKRCIVIQNVDSRKQDNRKCYTNKRMKNPNQTRFNEKERKKMRTFANKNKQFYNNGIEAKCQETLSQ